MTLSHGSRSVDMLSWIQSRNSLKTASMSRPSRSLRRKPVCRGLGELPSSSSSWRSRRARSWSHTLCSSTKDLRASGRDLLIVVMPGTRALCDDLARFGAGSVADAHRGPWRRCSMAYARFAPRSAKAASRLGCNRLAAHLTWAPLQASSPPAIRARVRIPLHCS